MSIFDEIANDGVVSMDRYRGRPAARSRVAQVERRKSLRAGVGLAALLLLAGGALAIGGQQKAQLVRDTDSGCLVHGSVPVAILAVQDVTDPLAAASSERFKGLMLSVREKLPRNGRLTLVPFGGDLGRSPAPVFDGCSPGRGEEAKTLVEGPNRLERAYRSGFAAQVDAAAAALQTAPPSFSSPIAAQIQRIVTDPAIHWDGDAKRLILFTDGLENTPASRIYAGGPLILPPPVPGLLAGVTVDYVELANHKAPGLQTAALRAAWRDWLLASGATRVNMHAEGFKRSTL